MFTGIVEKMAEVIGVRQGDRAVGLEIHAPGLLPSVAIGDSLCVSGVCLTVVNLSESTIGFDVVEETLQRSTLGRLTTGDRVNLERPVSLNSLLGGHLVQGHVDAVGIIQRVEDRGAERWICVGAPPDILRYVVEKGSIALDGVSMTVAEIDEASLSVALIPHTAAATTLGLKASGDGVNVEVDILAKHLEKLAAAHLGIIPGVGGVMKYEQAGRLRSALTPDIQR